MIEVFKLNKCERPDCMESAEVEVVSTVISTDHHQSGTMVAGGFLVVNSRKVCQRHQPWAKQLLSEMEVGLG